MGDILLSLAKECDILEDVNDGYIELIELLGIELTLKLFRYYGGCQVNYPKHFFKADFVAKAASQRLGKREKERLAVACGYTVGWIEKLLGGYRHS